MGAIAGRIGRSPAPDAGATVERMLRAQSHRGAASAAAQVGLGAHRIDLGCLYRPADPRPLAERRGYALAFDGFIANAGELRRAVIAEGGDAKEASTAEVLLEVLARWGTAALERIHGGWSLVFVDRFAQQVWIARDHLGCRPLYAHPGADGWLFASEVKGILHGAGARFAVNAQVVARYLDQTLLDAQPETFFAGVRSVPAGHFVALDASRGVLVADEPVAFWTIPGRDAFAGPAAERVAAVRARLRDGAHRQLAGASRLGVLLSGGVDSSAVAAAVHAAQPNADVLLISGVNAQQPDPLIDAVARRLGRETHRFPMAIPASEALADLEALIGVHDEPVTSFAIVATYRLKRFAAELGASVLLGGFGADEVFAGKLVHMVFHVQSLLRSGRVLAAARAALEIARRGTIRPRFRVAFQKRYFPALDRTQIDVAGPVLAARRSRVDLGLGQDGSHARLLAEITRLSLPSVLHYDDRTSSAFGIENRYALLDAPLVELVAPMAPGWKLRGGYPKWLLREAIDPLLPREVTWQKVRQSGGRDEYGDWLKRDLQTYIRKVIGGDLAGAALGLLDREAVRRHYTAFCAQPSGIGAISPHDVFGWLAVELWARKFEPYLAKP